MSRLGVSDLELNTGIRLEFDDSAKVFRLYGAAGSSWLEIAADGTVTNVYSGGGRAEFFAGGNCTFSNSFKNFDRNCNCVTDCNCSNCSGDCSDGG